MENRTAITRWALAGIGTLGLVIALAAWTNHPRQHQLYPTQINDTTPDKKYSRDLDHELEKLEEARARMAEMKEKDWQKMERDVEESIQKIDFEKIQREAQEAMQRMNLEKTQQQIEESLSRIDFDKIQQQIDESMQDVAKVNKEEVREALQKAKAQVKEAMENQHWKQDMEQSLAKNRETMQKQMLAVQQEMQKVKDQMRVEKFNFSKEMEKAQAELDNAKKELKGYQDMIYAMEKAGLLNTKTNYSIEFKNDELFINGQKQPADITNRYKHYFRKDKITIKKEDGEMHIHHNSNKHFD